MVAKFRYNVRSYTIFSAPAMKQGTLISEGLAKRNPANRGLIAPPVVRATPVNT
jgi:hypothetical protein